MSEGVYLPARSRFNAKAARELTQYPDRILAMPLPKHARERFEGRWWLIGSVRVLGEAERWEVLYDPDTDEGRLRVRR